MQNSQIRKLTAVTLTLLLLTTMIPISTASAANSGGYWTTVYVQEAISDPVLLLERAKANHHDDQYAVDKPAPSMDSAFRRNSSDVDSWIEVVTYSTSQLLEKRTNGVSTEETYLLAGITRATEYVYGTATVGSITAYSLTYYTRQTGHYEAVRLEQTAGYYIASNPSTYVSSMTIANAVCADYLSNPVSRNSTTIYSPTTNAYTLASPLYQYVLRSFSTGMMGSGTTVYTNMGTVTAESDVPYP